MRWEADEYAVVPAVLPTSYVGARSFLRTGKIVLRAGVKSTWGDSPLTEVVNAVLPRLAELSLRGETVVVEPRKLVRIKSRFFRPILDLVAGLLPVGEDGDG